MDKKNTTPLVVVPVGARITGVVHVNGKRYVNIVTKQGTPRTIRAERA